MKRVTAAQSRFKTDAGIIKALAHATRLLILDELSRGERCVRALTELVGAEMPTVSRHLSLLKSAGIIEDERRGAQVFYRVRIPCVLEVFSCLKAIENSRHRAEVTAKRPAIEGTPGREGRESKTLQSSVTQ